MKCVKNIFFDFHRSTFLTMIITLLFILAAVPQCLLATPINNYYEPVMIHTVFGTDKYYTDRPQIQFNFTLSPYYLHSASTKDGLRKKVPAGERLGQWNMFGVFYNLGTMKTTDSEATAPSITAIQTALEKDKMTGTLFKDYNFVDSDDETDTIYYPDPSRDNVGDGGQTVIGSFWKLPVDYEKIGLRGQASLDFGFGCGLVVKGGVTDCKATPKFLFDTAFNTKAGIPSGTSETIDKSVAAVYNNLVSPNGRTAVANALGINLNEYRKTGFEDTHVQFYWNIPFDIKDKEGDVNATIIPRLSVGTWIPTAKAVDVDKIFAAPLGNNGFWALTAEGALSFDFPQTIQTSVGGGLVICETKAVWQRMPNDIHQSGLYPWKTKVDKEPGITWYANASFKADNFTDGLSCYFDYIFTQHCKDSLTLHESDQARRTAFGTAHDKAVQESAWRSQQWNSGINYKPNETVAFGFAVQSHITGVRVYRPTTIIGSIALTF